MSMAKLPELLDCRGLQAELGVKRAAAERIMEQLPIVRIPNLKRVYVLRDDVARLIEDSTVTEKQ